MKALNEYPTPLIDASGIWISVKLGCDLERKLAMCREALTEIQGRSLIHGSPYIPFESRQKIEAACETALAATTP